MSLAAGLWLGSVWLLIHAIKHAARRRKLLLPVAHTRGRPIEVAVQNLSLRLTTDSFNVFHDQLSTRLSPNRSRVWRQSLLRFYDLGCLASLVGMLLGLGLLLLTAVTLSSEVLHIEHHGASTVSRRELAHVAADALRVNLVIPGITVPLGHLPLILVALGISQIVHEAGHAITAALHRIPMLSCGVAVTLLLPSAFVTLPASQLEKLPARYRLQILSGGCFHNFVFLCLLFSAAWCGVGSLPTWFLFQDISPLGRLIVSVDYDSPFLTHLPVGALITKIDDVPMASASSDDPWDRYLLSPSAGSIRGWCLNDSLLSKAPACTSVGPHSCFISKEDDAVQYSLDPVPVFTESVARCNFSAECSSFSSCVVPRGDQQLVRISVSRNYASMSIEDTVVWKGPKEEIWEQVRVGSLRSRFSFVSSKLPRLASAFFEYMKIANLSLYLVNMLPISALDGYQSLVALLQLLYGRASDGSESIDLEALNSPTRLRREGRVQRACRTLLSFCTLVLVVLCGLLGAISWATK